MEGTGLNRLLERIDARIEEDPVRLVHLRVPQEEGKMLALLEARSRIYSRAYKNGAVEFEADAPESVVRRVKEFVVADFDVVEMPAKRATETIKRDGRR